MLRLELNISVDLLFIHWVVTSSLRPHGLQHSRLPCPSLSPRVCSKSCPLSWWCRPTVSTSIAPFTVCPQSFPESGSFPMIGSSHHVAKYWSFTFSPSKEFQGWFLIGSTGLMSLQPTGLSRVFSRTTIQKQQFFGNQPSLWSNSHIHTRLLKKRSFDYMDFSGQVLLCFLKHCLCLSQVFFHG